MDIPVTLNVKSANNIPILSCMQGDTPTIVCTIMNGTDVFDVTSNDFDLFVCEGETAKHKAVSINCSNISGNKVSVKMTKNETDEAGDIKLCIRFSNTEHQTVISTFPFILKSTENPSYSAMGQMDNVSALTDYVAEAKIYADSAKNANADVIDFADTAKIYADNALESANAALTSANEAAESVRMAQSKANEAAENSANASESASAAATSATKAGVSEKNAAASATSASENATNAQNYAVGSNDSAKYYYEQAKAISESFSGALRPMGTVTFANLPAVSSATEGDMYNVSDEFVTTSDFKEGSGNVIPQGSNVYKTADEKWDVLAGSPVTGVKGAAETIYRRGNVNITPEDIGIIVDSELSAISTNPVQNKVIADEISDLEQSIADLEQSIVSSTNSLTNSYNALSSSVNGINGTLNQYKSTGAISQGLNNNLVTTEAGYALDARQGKALQDEIDTINGSLSWKEAMKPTELNEAVTFEHISQYVLETLSLCSLALKFTTKQTLTKGNDYELLSLVGFTPNYTQCNVLIYCDTNVVAVAIRPDKKIVLRPLISDIPINYQLSCQCIYKF